MNETGKKLSAKKKALFYLATLFLLLLLVELLGRGAWLLALEKAVLKPSTVDMSHLIMDEEHLGYLLKRNHCDRDITYGRMDIAGDWGDNAPKWSLCSNSRGFRGGEFETKKPAETFRIVCMGDSHTMGESVELEQTYCEKLKEYLNANGCLPNKKIETINAGISGYSSFHGVIAYLKYVVDWRPDLVILAYGSNDAMPLKHAFRTVRDREIYKLPGDEHIKNFYRLPKSGIGKIYYLAERVLFERSQTNELMEGNRSTVEEFAENISFLVDNIRKDSGDVILLANIIKNEDYIIAEEKIARQKGVPIVETISLFAEAAQKIHEGKIYKEDKVLIESWLKEGRVPSANWMSKYVTNDDVHPNHVGHDIIAREISRIICGERFRGIE